MLFVRLPFDLTSVFILQDSEEKAKISDMVKAYMAERDNREAEQRVPSEAGTPSRADAQASPSDVPEDQAADAGVDV